MADAKVYDEQSRMCDLGYLRTAYIDANGTQGWRCATEPVDDYVRKGGDIGDTTGRKCLCNALISNIGLGQIRQDGSLEPTLVTSGDDVADVARFPPRRGIEHRAKDVIDYLLGSVVEP